MINECQPLGKGTKSPLPERNRSTICNQIDNCIKYSKQLSDEKHVSHSNRKMPILGLIADQSVRLLAET